MEGEAFALFSKQPARKRPRLQQQQTRSDEAAPAVEVQHLAAEEGGAEAAGEPGTTSFRDLGLSEWLDKVCQSLGMREPTTVQRGTIPAVLAGRDVIGVAHTGSGKTAAFALPILQRLAKDPFGVFALVLTPTRELAFQLADQFRALGAGMSLKDCVVVGGLDMQQQAKALARRPHVVIATPGRLAALVAADAGLARAFVRARFLVLDEADRLLEPSFEAELATVLAALPAERQTLLFSATMTKTLVALQARGGTALLRDAYHFQAYEGLQTAAKLREEYLFVPAKECHLLSLLLEELGIPCAGLHSHKPQRARLAALDRFKGGGVPILLATDVASRGLDIPSVDLVVNYDLPLLARDYVHRVGRTARAGRRGWSLSFVTQYDIELVQKIEELVGKQLEKWEPEEKEVLKSITKVYAARRAASLRIEEEEALRGGNAVPGAAAAAARRVAAHKQRRMGGLRCREVGFELDTSLDVRYVRRRGGPPLGASTTCSEVLQFHRRYDITLCAAVEKARLTAEGQIPFGISSMGETLVLDQFEGPKGTNVGTSITATQLMRMPTLQEASAMQHVLPYILPVAVGDPGNSTVVLYNLTDVMMKNCIPDVFSNLAKEADSKGLVQPEVPIYSPTASAQIAAALCPCSATSLDSSAPSPATDCPSDPGRNLSGNGNAPAGAFAIVNYTISLLAGSNGSSDALVALPASSNAAARQLLTSGAAPAYLMDAAREMDVMPPGLRASAQWNTGRFWSLVSSNQIADAVALSQEEMTSLLMDATAVNVSTNYTFQWIPYLVDKGQTVSSLLTNLAINSAGEMMAVDYRRAWPATTTYGEIQYAPCMTRWYSVGENVARQAEDVQAEATARAANNSTPGGGGGGSTATSNATAAATGDSGGGGDGTPVVAIVVPVVCGAVVIVLLKVFVALKYLRHRKRTAAAVAKAEAVAQAQLEHASAATKRSAVSMQAQANGLGDGSWLISADNIHLLDQLGSGVFATVYRAKWGETKVAVKRFRVEGSTSSDADSEGISWEEKQEASLMATIRHPNCIMYLGACLEPPCLVMELCSKGSLLEVLRKSRGRLAWSRCVSMAFEAAKGMQYLHSCSPPIIHRRGAAMAPGCMAQACMAAFRLTAACAGLTMLGQCLCRDLKSPNLLVTSAWQVKVSDFGLSKSLSGPQTMTSIGGPANPRWVAPEVLDGKDYSTASDVYAMGVILWELLTSRLPWEAEGVWRIAALVRDGQRPPIPPPEECAGFVACADYVRLMTACWAQDPAARPTFDDVCVLLRLILEKTAVAAKDSSGSIRELAQNTMRKASRGREKPERSAVSGEELC
eukprot:scaffold6.g2763.t1